MKVNKYTTLLNEDRLAYLVKEETLSYDKEGKISNPTDVVNVLKSLFQADKLTEEHVWLLCLNTAAHLTGVFEMSKGTVNYACLEPREIYRNALLSNAVNIVIAHNHPSGESNPSKEDVAATNRIKQAGEIIGIRLLDHIIIGDTCLSMREENLM